MKSNTDNFVCAPLCQVSDRAVARSGRGRLAALVAGSSLMVIAAALAAQTRPAQAADSSSQVAQTQAEAGVAGEEIIVTARRRAENLQDVPQTVTAVSASTLQQLNLLNLSDISSLVGGVNILQVPGFADSFTIRGVSFNPDSTTTESAAFYINDAWVTNNFATNSNFDVGQIEVLSGPQGTTRGESAPTGSFTVTTHRADLEKWGGYFNGTVTQFGNINANGALNIPIVTDKLAIRLAYIVDMDDAAGVTSVNNTQGEYHHVYGGRASLQFAPNDDITANFMAQHLYIHDSDYGTMFGPGATGGTSAEATPGYNGPPIPLNSRESASFIPNTTLTHEDIVTAGVDWRVHGQKVHYNADYWDWGYTTGVGGNVQIPGETATNGISAGTYPQSTQWNWGQELLLSSDEPNRFWDYTAGVYYRHTLDHVYNFTGGSQEPGAFGSPLAPNPFVFNNNYVIYTDTVAPRLEKEFSANLSLTFHLPGNNELTAGGRYIDYKESGTITTQLLPGSEVAEPASVFHNLPCALLGFTSTYPGTCNVAIPGSPNVFHALVNGTGHPVVWNVQLSHKFNDDVMAYFSSASSWRPPAFTVGVINGTNNAGLNSILDMNPEKSYSFEGGIKSEWFDKKLRVNLDYYHQIYSPAIAGGSQGIIYLSNNGVTTPTVGAYPFSYNVPAKVDGVDADLGAQITKNWTADLSAGLAISHVNGTIPCNPPGNSNLPSAFPAGTVIFFCPSNESLSTRPNFSGSLQSEYDYPINNNVSAFLRGLYSYYGRNPNALSAVQVVEPAFGILNIYAGLRSPTGAWEATLFIKNALDTSKIISTGGPDLTNTAAVYSAFGDAGYHSSAALTPRQEFGMTVTYAFGSR